MLPERARTTWSRRVSYLLRHNPAQAGLTLTTDGWVPVATLLGSVPGLTADILTAVVDSDDKGRFQVEGDRIRCVHGHSAGVADHAHTTPGTPPPVLYHGTSSGTLAAIETEGLRPRSRRHVHLSATTSAAREVGARRGSPVVLTIDTAAAAQAGVRFYESGNGIWLTDHVPARFLTRHPAG